MQNMVDITGYQVGFQCTEINSFWYVRSWQIMQHNRGDEMAFMAVCGPGLPKHIYTQISIYRSCGHYFYKFELPEVQIDLHFG